jgi:hypothetical protein
MGHREIAMLNRSQHRLLAILTAGVFVAVLSGTASASDDKTRNELAQKNCVRGKFKDYNLQGQGGDSPASYKGRVLKLSQNYLVELAPEGNYLWLKIDSKDGDPVDPRAYLQALDYGLEGNVGVDFYVEDNKIRKWYGMPWMDWNTEVASDWLGTGGRGCMKMLPETCGNRP